MRQPTRRLALLGLFVAAALATRPFPADADRRAARPAEAAARLRAAAARAGVPHYVRKMPSGVERVVLNPADDAQLAAVEAETGKGSNVLQIIHLGRADSVHTRAIWNGRLLHFQYATGSNNWRLRGWGKAFRPRGNMFYGAMIQLSDAEAERLDGFLAAAGAQQGPEADAGHLWANGHITDGLGIRNINCVAGWCDLPIGDAGEPLWRVAGLGNSYSANPRGFQKALESLGGDRVFGVAVYGQVLRDFLQTSDRDVTHL